MSTKPRRASKAKRPKLKFEPPTALAFRVKEVSEGAWLSQVYTPTAFSQGKLANWDWKDALGCEHQSLPTRDKAIEAAREATARVKAQIEHLLAYHSEDGWETHSAKDVKANPLALEHARQQAMENNPFSGIRLALARGRPDDEPKH